MGQAKLAQRDFVIDVGTRISMQVHQPDGRDLGSMHTRTTHRIACCNGRMWLTVHSYPAYQRQLRSLGANGSILRRRVHRTGHAACNCTRLSSACMPLTRLAWHRMWRSALRIPPLSPATDTWSPSPCDWLSQSPWWDVTPTTTTRPPSPWLSRAVGDPTFPRR